MSKAQAAATSNRKSSFSAAALVTTKDTLTFQLHPKQLVALRSKATEILYRGAAGGGKPHLMRPPRAGCYPSTWLAMCYPGLSTTRRIAWAYDLLDLPFEYGRYCLRVLLASENGHGKTPIGPPIISDRP
jgi:hypothetical protein